MKPINIKSNALTVKCSKDGGIHVESEAGFSEKLLLAFIALDQVLIDDYIVSPEWLATALKEFIEKDVPTRRTVITSYSYARTIAENEEEVPDKFSEIVEKLTGVKI